MKQLLVIEQFPYLVAESKMNPSNISNEAWTIILMGPTASGKSTLGRDSHLLDLKKSYNIILSTIRNPDILILDESTSFRCRK